MFYQCGIIEDCRVMAAHREIISLQFGHFSNFIGTHWWNIQELGFDYTSSSPSEINHDVLFREGETRNGQVTFTPRLLLADLKGSLGTLPEHGGLYEEAAKVPDPTNIKWNKPTEVVAREKTQPNEFLTDLEKPESGGENKYYDLDPQVDVWSDFLRTRYHPRTINVVNNYTHRSETSSLDVFTQGTNLWGGEQFSEHFVDQLRLYAEECDSLQGFHVILDCVNGFSGLGTSAIQYLSDEYTRKSIFAFPSAHGYYQECEVAKEALRMANTALCLQSLSHHCNMIVPLSTYRGFWQQCAVPRDFEHLQYKPELAYHSSSILAATLDCATLRYRLRVGSIGLEDLAQELVAGGRKAVAASINLPFPMKDRSFLLDTLEQWEGPLWQSLSSCCDLSDDRIWAQSVVLRGIPNSKLKSPDMKQTSNPAHTSTRVDEMLRYFLECTATDTVNTATAVTAPSSVGTPFPHIFSPLLKTDGFLGTEPRPNNIGVSKVPVLAGLHSCRSMGAMLESLQAQAAHHHWRKLPQLAEAGMERDEYLESLEQLMTFAECYNEEFEV